MVNSTPSTSDLFLRELLLDNTIHQFKNILHYARLPASGFHFMSTSQLSFQTFLLSFCLDEVFFPFPSSVYVALHRDIVSFDLCHNKEQVTMADSECRPLNMKDSLVSLKIVQINI